jgi:hypothetical protein
MRSKIVLLIALLFSLLPPLHAADTLLVTEFMAANSSTLTDEDGAYSDWVEIYNASANTVNIGGWYLTDNAGDLTKWQFPATNMAPHTFMVVFCSSKDRRVPGRPLHTSFALGAGGEYLALVRPDGTTVASAFAPQFPNQFNDVAYGYVMTGTSTTLLSSGAGARALVPASDIGDSWRGTNYNDSAWTSGITGAGYDQGTNYTPAIGLDLGAAMSNVNASAYLRVPFNVPDPGLFKALTLRMRYDDGFVAYLNGTEIARRNAPPTNAWNSTATANHGPPPPGALIENFESGNSQYTVHQYGAPLGPVPTNQPAGAGSTGNFFRLLYDGNNGAFNSVAFRQTAPGLFQTITADFDFRMMNAVANPADGWAFMLIPTKTYGTNGPGVNTQPQGIEEPNFPGVFSVGVDVYPHGTQNDVSVHWNAGEKVNVTMPRPAYELVNNQFHHMKVTLQHVQGGARVTVTLTFNVNGTPSAPYTPIDNLFVAGLDPYDCRVQFAARTGGLNHGLDLDNLNVQFSPPPGLIAFEDFDVTPALAALAPGVNLLAIHGLNLTASDSDFLMSPEIVGSDFLLTTNATYIAPSTPGTWNNVAGAGTLSEVTFSLPSGAYTSNSLSVALASSSSSAQIRYTLNGATPTGSSLLYSGPITITTNTVVRARAFEAGKVDSEITAANYILIDPALTNFTSNLPLVIIDTMGGTVVAETPIPGYVVLIDTNGPAGRTRFNGPFNFTGRAGVELHGQSSLGFPKQSMNLETRDETDDDDAASLLGFPSGSDWTLYAPYTDKTFMNDFLTYELHEAMGHYAVRRKFVEVFVRSTAGRLNTNDYRGIYVLLEKIRIDADRVDISEPQSGAPDDPITGGYIWKRDKGSPGMVEFTTPNQPYTVAANGVSMQYHDPRGDQLSLAQRAWLKNYLTEFENVLYGPNFRDPLYGYLNYIDPDSFVDQHWAVEFPKNIDGYRLSNYMHKDRDGKIKMEPIWDWNLSWGNANYLEGGYTNGWYYPLLGGGDDMWLNRLRADPDFNQRIIDRWGQLRTNVFALSNLIARIDRITNQLAEAQLRDFVRWPRLGVYVWPNPDGALGGAPSGRNWDINFVAPTTYANIIQQQKIWVTGRHKWVESQFLIPPTISKPGGFVVPGTTLTLTGTLGSIYYTLDGTDPRASGGGISPSASLYSGGTITLSNNAGVFARSFYTNRWSAPAREIYVVATPSLGISEIMYHPADPPTNSPYSESDFEYIEIKNTGTSTLNLLGARLAGGIDYTFQLSALVPTGAPTSNSFNGAGTPYTASMLNNPGAPDGNGEFLRLIHGGNTNLVRNRIAFAQTATGSYGRVTADFDFRATTVSPAISNGVPTLQDFEGAVGTTNYTLAGSAAVTTNDAGSTGKFLRLVPAAASLTGTAGFTRTAPGTWNTVVASFDFRVTPGAGQADGMSVAFLNTTTYGTNGAAPGMSEEPNLSGSIGIGIDVYNNAEVNNNHVSLHYGSIVGAPVTPSFDLSNGRFHRAQVIIRFRGGRALVTMRVTPDINAGGGAGVTLFEDAVINGVNPYEMRLAFGARTGGENAAHDVDNISVQYSSEVNTAAGLSMVMLPTGTFGASGAGSTLAHFTDAPALTNGLALDLSFHPSNYVNDVALYWNASRAVGAFVPPAALNLDNGVFHHAHVVLDTYPGGAYLTVVLTPDGLGMLGMPGAPIVVASNLFIVGATPANWRVEFAGRNGLIDTTLDLENVNVNYEAFASLLLAPGECILVVKNRAAFESRYGTGYRIAGEFSGQLDNAGDHIVLLGPVGELILDFTYSDDWYRLTDGLGFSLVNVNPNAPNSSYSSDTNWRNSSYQHGSPGEVDPVLNIAPIVVNEVLANSVPPDVDRIELFNPTTNAVNIGGWFVTDDFPSPKKFQIPIGTVIAAGGFAVFDEADFNSSPGSETSFAISSDGDEIYLFSGDTNGNLTGYVHGFDFGGAEEGVSFGRYVDSFGEDHFPAQLTTTFGATNSGPRVGPVVISEIMYRPPDINGSLQTATDNSVDEFIELLNITSAAVPLYSTALPTDTWRLRDAVDFDFPLNTTLAANEAVRIVSFDPTNTAMVAAFRTKYNLNPGMRIFGPYSGKLDNSGDNIHLNKPTPPGTNGTIYVRADAVSYRDSYPWNPVADGYGASLQKNGLVLYGNDPGNWTAAAPDMHGGPGGFPPAITVQPVGATIVGGRSTNFSVGAVGANLRYQWRVNGTNIVGATNATLDLSNIQLTQAGDYYVGVFNDISAVLSDPAHLTVIAPVLFTLQPASQFVLPGTNVTITAAAIGGGPVTYQWRFNGVDIPNATNASYSFTGANLANHHGNFSVVGSDGFTSTVSSNAFIYVLVRPGFIVQPTPVVVVQGGKAVFSVVATGAPPLYYRWIRNGVGILTNTSPVLVLTNVPLANPNPMPIRCAVTNQASGAGGVNSLTVQMLVQADADGDGIGDAWETNYSGFSTNNAADGALDFDGDGASNRDEYVAATNPTNALSVLKLALTTIGSATPALEFVAQSNLNYTVQYRTNLSLGGWLSLSNVPGLINTVRTIQVTAPNPPPNWEHYYRVATPAVP